MSTVEKSAVSRRKVAAGIAWSVPAIALASAAPFAAASPEATCISLLDPVGNAPSCATAQSTLTKVAYADDGNSAIRTLTTYVRFQIPSSVQVSKDKTVSFTYQLVGAGAGFTVSVGSADNSGAFTWSASQSGSAITLTATANENVVSGTTVYSASLVVTISGENNANANSATFRMIASQATSVTACAIPAKYGTQISFPKKYADASSGLTQCRSGDNTRTIYFY